MANISPEQAARRAIAEHAADPNAHRILNGINTGLADHDHPEDRARANHTGLQDHNATLSGVQGGSLTERYHLTADQHEELTSGVDTTIHTHAYAPLGSFDGRVAKTGMGYNTATGAYDTTLTYDEVNRTITLSPTGTDYKVYIQGTEFTKTAVSLSHTDADGGHFFYFDDTGTFVCTTTPWNLLRHAPVAYVFWDATNNVGIPFEERHHAGRDVFWHQNQHFAEGTKVTSGFLISSIAGYALDTGSDSTPEDTNVTYSIASGRFEDEDIRVDTEVLAKGSDYTGMKRVGATSWQVFRGNDVPFFRSGFQIVYNQLSLGSYVDTPVPNNSYVNYWIFGLTALPRTDITPSPAETQQIVFIPGQFVHGTLALANAESVASISWGTVPFQELVPLYRVTMRYRSATGTEISAVARVIGSAATITASAPSDHGAQAGLLDDDHPQYALTDGSRGNFTPNTHARIFMLMGA